MCYLRAKLQLCTRDIDYLHATGERSPNRSSNCSGNTIANRMLHFFTPRSGVPRTTGIVVRGTLPRRSVIVRLSSDYVQNVLSSRQAPTLHETHRLFRRHWIMFPESLVLLFGEHFFGSRIRKHIDHLDAIRSCSPNRSSDCSGDTFFEVA